MTTPLRVLIVEDSEDDTFLLLRELRRGGYDPTYQRVETAEAMRAALDRQVWNVVIADYVMPHFNGLAALELLKETAIDLPFIVVSGKITDEMAVAAMKAGAHDYIMKDNMARLVPAVERELREAEVRRERKRAEEALAEKSMYLDNILRSATEYAIATTDLDLRIQYYNPMAEKIHGYTAEEVIGRTVQEMHLKEKVSPERLAQAIENVRRFGEYRYTAVKETDEGTRYIDHRVSGIYDSAGELVGFANFFRDVTEQRQAEEALRRAHDELETRVQERTAELVKANQALQTEITARRYVEEKLRYLGAHDALTGLYNRAFFEEEMARLGRGRQFPVSVVMADIDGLKAVNDNQGHAAGDELLRGAAAVLRSAFRAEDVVARIGGDEFAVLLPGADATAAEEALARVVNSLLAHNTAHGDLPLRLSVGTATAERGRSLTEALKQADERMYQEKHRRMEEDRGAGGA